ncbi:MAG: response regulator transcription factor [Chlorobi bacterium]|nr:response regulator transcription factor [Chlorobiota bacterium]
MINVSVVDEHLIFSEALGALVSGAEDINLVSCHTFSDELILSMRENLVHIAIITVRKPDKKVLQDIKALNYRSPKLKILVLTIGVDEKFILQLIKVGAKGHISSDSGRFEILEAVYSLRNGFEFYAKTITNLLLNSYLNDKESKSNNNHSGKLSPRETEVLKLFADGKTNKQIADILFISIRTVETHKTNIMKKINIKTTVDLVKFAIKNNIIKLD